jgi:hypothetical protein
MIVTRLLCRERAPCVERFGSRFPVLIYRKFSALKFAIY